MTYRQINLKDAGWLILLILPVILLQVTKVAGQKNVGIGTTTPAARLHVADSNVLFSGTSVIPLNTNFPPPAQGSGSRLMWYPQRSAFRVGTVTGPQWDATNTGRFSFASGYNTTASGAYATAMGTNSIASGDYSCAFNGSIASGPSSFSSGGSTASGYYSTSTGF